MLSDQAIKLQIRSVIVLIEEKAHGMHQKVAQQASPQMPQITRPDSFHLTTIRQLSEHRVDEIAHSSQDRALVSSSLGRMSLAKRGLQDNAFGTQIRLQVGKPIIAISQHDPCCPFQQHGRNFSIRLIGGSQEHVRQHTRPTQLSMQTKPIKGLSICMIFAIPCIASEADTPRSASKAAHRNWHAIHNGQTGIIADQFIAQPTPQPFFDGPQIGCLTNKGGTVQAPERRKKVRIVLLKVVEQLLILRQTQVTSNYFHRDDFTIRQLWGWTFSSQSLVFHNHWHHLVNQTETCDNKIVQVHENSPSKDVSVF